MEHRTLVVMASMGLLNICFGLVDAIQANNEYSRGSTYLMDQ